MSTEEEGGLSDHLTLCWQVCSVKHWKRRFGELHAEVYPKLPLEPYMGIGIRPTIFWWYADGIPASLRGTGRAKDIDDDSLTLRRVRWLLGPGREHLRDGEAVAILERFGGELGHGR